jgi:hypothetical protein
MNLRSLLASTFGVAILAQVAAPAGAVSFSENFNSAPQGLNLSSGVPSFSVASGNVDVIGTNFYNLYSGNGNYVDLTGQNTQLTSSAFNFLSGDTVTLSFDYGANASGAVGISIGSFFNDTLSTLQDSSSFKKFTKTFTVANATIASLSFLSTSGGPGGIILDNISLTSTNSATAVPEPTAIPGLLLFGGAAVVLRRKQVARNAKMQFDA